MKICRFKTNQSEVRVGWMIDDSTILDLTPTGISRMQPLLESDDPAAEINRIKRDGLPSFKLADVQLCAPVERQEVWAAGVTYLRSKSARMEESDFSATAYDRVYSAERPELFFKATPEKVVATGEPVGIRRDARWNVPEPELALVLNSRGEIAGFTIGNDMSSRDIEGENLLYLPQAKIYDRSCALGPLITLAGKDTESKPRSIRIAIHRGGQRVFSGETSTGQIKRSFDELASFLFRCQKFPQGAVLLTGTGIVPTEAFTLAAGDEIEIEIEGIGTLKNPVTVV